MALTVTFNDYKRGIDGIGGSTIPVDPRIVDKSGATYYGAYDGYLAFDASYPTGGYALSASALGFEKVSGVHVESSGGYTFEYNRSTGKVQAFSAAGTEVANATNLSALQSAHFVAYGSL